MYQTVSLVLGSWMRSSLTVTKTRWASKTSQQCLDQIFFDPKWRTQWLSWKVFPNVDYCFWRIQPKTTVVNTFKSAVYISFSKRPPRTSAGFYQFTIWKRKSLCIKMIEKAIWHWNKSISFILSRYLFGPAPDDSPYQGTQPFVLREGPWGTHHSTVRTLCAGSSPATSKPWCLDIWRRPSKLSGLKSWPRAAQQRLLVGRQTVCCRHTHPDPEPKPWTKTGVFIRKSGDSGQSE